MTIFASIPNSLAVGTLKASPEPAPNGFKERGSLWNKFSPSVYPAHVLGILTAPAKGAPSPLPAWPGLFPSSLWHLGSTGEKLGFIFPTLLQRSF